MRLLCFLKKIRAALPLNRPPTPPQGRPSDVMAGSPPGEDGNDALFRGKADSDSGEDQLVTGWLFGFKRDHHS